MVSRLRLCNAIQSARASASATVVIASTSTASYSPKIKVEVIGSKPSASPKGLGRSPTIGFPGAVKTFTLSVVVATGAAPRAASFSPGWSALVASMKSSFRVKRATVQGNIDRCATANPLDQRIDGHQSIGRGGPPAGSYHLDMLKLPQSPVRRCAPALALAPCFSAAAFAQQYDIVITNGRVMDPETGLDAIRN